MIKYAIILLLIFSALLTFAQPPVKTYEQTQREKANADYNASYIDALRRNTNTPYKPMGVDNKAAQELAEQWRRNNGKRTDAEIKADNEAGAQSSKR